MSELKEALIMRLAEVSAPNQSNHSVLMQRRRIPNPANHPNQSNRAPNHANDSPQSSGAAMRLLTPQERRVFQLCFQSGFLTYDEIAKYLDITAVAAKNLVNRIFQSDRKRSLFSKEYKHGSARVGIHSGLEKKILTGGVHRDETEGSAEPSPAAAKDQTASRRFPARGAVTQGRAKARRATAQVR
jgi:DNA-binding CsgD family transcriptional regulator